MVTVCIHAIGRLVVALKDKCGLKILTPQELAEVVGVGDLPVEALKEYKSFLQSVVHTTIEKGFRSISPEKGHIDLFSLFDIKDINTCGRDRGVCGPFWVWPDRRGVRPALRGGCGAADLSRPRAEAAVARYES